MTKRKSGELEIAVQQTPDAAVVDAILAGLTAFNNEHNAPPEYIPLTIAARDGTGAVRAGIDGQTFFGWFFVRLLWVDADYRHQGIGSDLLRMAEAIALERGCAASYLTTYSFQAPQFYKNHGYVETGRLEGFPPGYDSISMRKTLSAG